MSRLKMIFPSSYGQAGFPRQNRMSWAVREAAQQSANAQTIARAAAKKIAPIAAASAGEVALAAAGMAVPLLASPMQFLFGEGPGTFTETQELESQIQTLGRLLRRPLTAEDLKPESLQEIASDPELVERLHGAGYLSNELRGSMGAVAPEEPRSGWGEGEGE